MTYVDKPAALRHPFLDGKPKRLFIGGQWVEAKSGKTFQTHNPASGDVLAEIAEGDAADIDLAVTAARAAFEGAWSKWKPADRQRLLLKLRDPIAAPMVAGSISSRTSRSSTPNSSSALVLTTRSAW